MRREWQRFIHLWSHAPMLHTYSSDGTPASYFSRERKLICEEAVTRSGKRNFESYNQRSSLFVFGAHREGHFCKLFKDPTLLGSHTCEVLVAVWCLFDACPRKWGHTGLLVESFCWDGAIFEKMSRLVGGWIPLMLPTFLNISEKCNCRLRLRTEIRNLVGVEVVIVS